jgi:hypothetical protein
MITETETYMCKNLHINGNYHGDCTLTFNKNYNMINDVKTLESTNWFIITTCNLFGLMNVTYNDDIVCEEIDTNRKFSGRGFPFGFTIIGKSELIIS